MKRHGERGGTYESRHDESMSPRPTGISAAGSDECVIRSSASASLSSSPCVVTPVSSKRITSTIHLAPSSQPAASASPRGVRPAVFLMSIRSTPGPSEKPTSARAVSSCELSAAQCSAVEPALFCADRRDDGTMGRRTWSRSANALPSPGISGDRREDEEFFFLTDVAIGRSHVQDGVPIFITRLTN